MLNIPALDAIDTATKANEGVKIAFTRLDGSPLLNALGEPVGVVVQGTDSDAWREINRVVGRRRLERTKDRKDGEAIPDAELDQRRAEEIEMLVAVTTGWFGMIDADNKPVKFTKPGAIRLYESYPMAREQTDIAIADRTRFIKA